MDDQLLIESLEIAVETFKKDELAYLSLSSKGPLPIRDKLAFVLHERLSEHFISRELGLMDLAILQKKDPDLPPKAIINFYEMQTHQLALIQKDFDVDVLPDDKLPTLVEFEKMAAHEQKLIRLPSRADIYTILFVSHSGEDTLKNLAILAVKEEFKDKNVIDYGMIQCGRAYEADFEIIYWVLKANPFLPTH